MNPTTTHSSSPGGAILVRILDAQRQADRRAELAYRAAFTRRPVLAQRIAERAS